MAKNKKRTTKISKSKLNEYKDITNDDIPCIKHLISLKNDTQEICINCKNMRNFKNIIGNDICVKHINPQTGKYIKIENTDRCALFDRRKIEDKDDHWEIDYNGNLRTVEKDRLQ